METVTLNRCTNCQLMWVDEGDFEICPRCRKHHTAPLSAVIGGIEVQVEKVVLYGDDMGLHDSRVRRGLEGIRLGFRCGHGYLTPFICPTCNGDNKIIS